MNKAIIGLTVLAILVVAAVFFRVNNSGVMLSLRAVTSLPKIETGGYRLDALGSDLRAYEWTSPSDATVTCVFVVSSKGQSGINCF